MKTKLYLNLSVIALFLFLCSCIDKHTLNDPKEVITSGEAQIAFTLGLSELNNKTKVDAVECPSLEDLKELADQGNLQVRFTVAKGYAPNELESLSQEQIQDASTGYAEKVKLVNQQFIADPVALPIGSHSLTQFTIWDISDENQEELLFSAVGEESEMFAPFIDDEFLLPMLLDLKEEDRYTKQTCEVFVICATNYEASDFGFKMWDTNFLHFYCIPFVVNQCDDDGLHIVAKGELRIFEDLDPDDKKYTKGKLITTIPFGDGVSKLCFADNYNYINRDEFYGFELYTEYKGAFNELPVSGHASVKELIDFQNSNAWDLVEDILDINLCDCESWFFQCQDYALGSYCIEDLWPNEGDYDFNDLIIEYRNSFIYTDNTRQQVSSLTLDYDVIAMGAGYQNNVFAVRFENIDLMGGDYKIKRSVDKQTGDGYETYLLEQTGLWDIGTRSEVFEITDKGVVILPVIDKVQDRFNLWAFGSGSPNQINVHESTSKFQGQGYQYRILIKFPQPIDANFEIKPMLIVRSNRQVEINMPFIEPSCIVAQQYYESQKPSFNEPLHVLYATYEYENSSDAAEEIRPYKPWIIDVPYLDIRYAKEGERVTNLFDPEFSSWARSLYNEYQDWFEKDIDQATLDAFWYNPNFNN